MAYVSSSRAPRLGALARRVLARRRRWLRWAAIALAALTILVAAAQVRHRPAPPRPAGPAGGVRGPASAPRFYGVAAQVPAGMRAVNLIVPAATTFGGRLAPGSRVDLVAAFDAGQDRVVRSVLTSSIVLQARSSPAPSGIAASSAPPSEARLAAGPVAELTLAVPASREREVVMAQAYGRLFLSVEPWAPTAATGTGLAGSETCVASSTTDLAGSLSLRRYLGLPAPREPSPSPALPAFLPAPPLPWPGVAVPRSPAATGRAQAQPSAERHGVTIELIEGTTRSAAEVDP